MSYHIPGSMCVGVTVWFGWVVWYPYAGCSVRVGCGGWGLMARNCFIAVKNNVQNTSAVRSRHSHSLKVGDKFFCTDSSC